MFKERFVPKETPRRRICGHQKPRVKNVLSFSNIKIEKGYMARVQATVGWENFEGDSNLSDWRFKFRGGQNPVFSRTSKLNVDQWPGLLGKDVTHHYMWSRCPRKPYAIKEGSVCKPHFSSMVRDTGMREDRITNT